MFGNSKGSRRQYKDFIKKRGIWRRGSTPKGDKSEGEDAEEQERKSPWPYLIRLLKEFREHRSRVVLVLFMGLVSNLVEAAFPWGGKFVIDTVLPQRAPILLFGFCAVLLLIAVCDVFIKFLQDYLMRTIGGNFTVQIKRRMMEHLQKLPLVQIQKLKVGGITARLQQDTQAMSGLVQQALISPFNAVIILGIALTSLMIVSWKVTLICLVMCLFIGFIAYMFFNVMRPFQKTLREDNSAISSSITETFGGVQVVKGFGREHTIKRHYALDTDLLWRKQLYATSYSIGLHRGVWFIFHFSQVAIWLVAGQQVIQGALSIGDLVLFITFINWIFRPIFMIMSTFSQVQQSLACAERAFDLMDEKPDIVDKPDAATVTEIKEKIEFEDVTFDYPDGTRALKSVSLTIPVGKTTALVGPSGGGKTTLINLVSRFYDVTEGKILIDGVDLRDAKVTEYRHLISLVLQDVFLFDGTVRENIAFGLRDATMEQVEKAAKVAHCHEFIKKLEKRYDTLIGEKGVKLSGGQKQRVALARAIITDPRLLILDEATSNLDSESEGHIQDALHEILKNRTTLVIAHRLSTIMDADNIIVLEDGELVEQGTHDDLLRQRGRYSEMYEKQMEKAKIAGNYWVNLNGDQKGDAS